MASIRGAQRSDRILGKLQRMIEDGEYYEAHQLYRTLYFRYSNSNKFNELRQLLFDGAKLFLVNGQHNSGADLASLYINALSSDPAIAEVLSDDQQHARINQNVGDLFANIPPKTPERMQFTVSALKLDPKVFKVSAIHLRFALVLWQEKNYPEARFHFLHSPDSCGHDCAMMLVEYQVSSGFGAEFDLFIAQFILQLLSLRQTQKASLEPPLAGVDSLKTLGGVSCQSNQHSLANRTLQSYTAMHPRISMRNPPFVQPLLNFLWFLLLAIDGGKSSIFKTLCDLYAPSLSRDPTYREYLIQIGEIHFGLKQPQRQAPFGGIFGNLLQSLMEDQDDSDDGGPPSSQQQQQPPTAQHSAPKRTVQVDNDLD